MIAPAKNVTVIPATLNLHTRAPMDIRIHRRVAAYARVSTDSEEQFTSYEAQIDYYTRYIQSHEDWEFVKVYTDEGISATNTKHRDGFNAMIADALDGKIDLIVTKSVSRFARNTVDSLTTVRKLKEKGVEVYFEKENIWTLDSKGELLITIMSSLAQEESRSISENVTWGQRKRFSDGKVNIPYGQFLGYKKGANGLPEIVEEEAAIVRRIYRVFMEGKTQGTIARTLTAEGIPTPGGKTKWQPTVVSSILTNEKYKGAALLQKRFTVDFLQKKTKVNEGEVPQYYVENSHPAIIQPEEWERVQAEIARRKKLNAAYVGTSVFSAKIFCGDCGTCFGPKVWHSTSKYRRVVWQCNDKFKGDHKCTTPHLTEETIQNKFLEAYNQLLHDREPIIADLRMVQQSLCDMTDLDSHLANISEELELTEVMIRSVIEDNATKVQNQTEYLERYEKYMAKLDSLKVRYEKVEKERTERQRKYHVMEKFIQTLADAKSLPIEFAPDTFMAVTDKITVFSDGHMEFTFIGGVTVSTMI